MGRIFKVGLIGTFDISIEEAEDSRAAAWKAGWDPKDCEVTDITDGLIEMRKKVELHDVKNILRG